ncbi:MAG TPA: hypothetical protein VGI83_05195 [Gemmatimonadales bacterium]|jgi:hypothetical protein
MGRTQLIAALTLAGMSASTAAAQSTSWQRKWYWGGQGGVMMYSTTLGGSQSAIMGGGHWLITGKRSALYISVNQIKYADTSSTQIADASAASTGGLRTVNFSSGRVLQAGIYIIPSDSKLQLLTGGGFAINEISDAVPVVDPLATQQEKTAAAETVDDATTKAFLWVSAGLQLRAGRWALFGTYQYMPAAKDFMINTGIQSLNFGLRYALTSAHEDVTTNEK